MVRPTGARRWLAPHRGVEFRRAIRVAEIEELLVQNVRRLDRPIGETADGMATGRYGARFPTHFRETPPAAAVTTAPQ